MDAIGELLEGALPDDRPGGALVPVLRAWADAVGPEIARHASPARRTREGDLVVHTSDAGWAQALTLMADDLVGKLAAALRTRRSAGAPLPGRNRALARRRRP